MADDFTPVKSAERALEILDLLARSRDGMSFVDIQRATGWPRSSAYNLLRTMTVTGHLEFDERDRVYRIGLRVWEAGQAYARTHDLGRTARPYLDAASRALNETVQLAVLDGLDNVYIAKVEADHHLKLVSEIGSRLPAYATGLGKALLAGLDPDEFERRFDGVSLERFTAHTIADKDALLAELAAIRERGYAVDHGEFSEGVFCIALPVRDADGQVVAAMSSSVPDARMDDQRRAAMQQVLTEQAQGLSIALGHAAPPRG